MPSAPVCVGEQVYWHLYDYMHGSPVHGMSCCGRMLSRIGARVL